MAGRRCRCSRRLSPRRASEYSRARRERPRRRAAKERDELAPFHYPMLPVLPTVRIAHLSYGRRLCAAGISIQPMSQMGETEKSRQRDARPVYPQQRIYLMSVATAVECHNRTHAPQQRHHSKISSARPDSGNGIVTPSARAVFMLMYSSTLVTCWTGRSPGFSPLSMRPV
jgi:hypothetical protein